MEAEADAYYSDDSDAMDEIDLSFLDDDDDDKDNVDKTDYSEMEDKDLARSIIGLRKNYADLTAANLSILEAMTAEYTRRGKLKYRLFLTKPLDLDNQTYLWGVAKEFERTKAEGFSVDRETNLLEVDSNRDTPGVVYHLNRRQLYRYNSSTGGNVTKGHAQAEVMGDNGKPVYVEVQLYVKKGETKK